MLANLALGTAMIAVTVLTHTLGLIALSAAMPNLIRWFRLHHHAFGRAIAMVVTVLGIFFIHTLEVWSWSAVYLLTGAFPDFDSALYFSTVTFSTLGYGDITLDRTWRLAASMEGIDGFILIGWSIAFLVTASTRYGPFRAGEHF